MRIKSFEDNKSILYLVATPIGNMQEVSQRTRDILNSVSVIGCEDTRVTNLFLQQLNISKPLISCHEHNENESSNILIKHLNFGENIAYVSDAGYPGLSDPGSRLVQKAIENGFKVSVVSGPSAFINALVASGLDTSHFFFYGFLASKPTQRKNELEQLKNREETIIFYESPHRIGKTLKDLSIIFGNRKACIARELTKKHEEFIRDSLDNLANLDSSTLLGEIVIVVEGNKNKVEVSNDKIIFLIKQYKTEALSTKELAKLVANKLKISKNYVYDLILKMEKNYEI